MRKESPIAQANVKHKNSAITNIMNITNTSTWEVLVRRRRFEQKPHRV